MKLAYEPLIERSMNTIHVKRTYQPYLAKNWHYHPEYEILYIMEGEGVRVVGDHISDFSGGELVLIGKWLPHLWRHDNSREVEKEADYINIKFLKEYKGINIFSLPELLQINQLLNSSSRGLLFDKNSIPMVHQLIVELVNSRSAEKMILFLQILQILCEQEDVQCLTSQDFILPTHNAVEDRLQKVINYIFKNYTRTITLNDISKIALLTPPSFCRFFKNRTNKTFFNFLNEFRISKACQLLTNTHKTTKEICYEVGFNSMTNFHRTFKMFRQTSPMEYRKRFGK